MLRRQAAWALGLAVLVCSAGCRTHPPHDGTAAPPRVVYGATAESELTLDVYPVATPGPHPACLLIHGGAWSAGSPASERGLGQALSRQGIVCFAVAYRLAPRYKYPTQVQDCARAARWVRAHAVQYGVDADRLGAWGVSAGGHLALLLGTMAPGDYQADDDPNRALSGKVGCVVDFFGPADLRGSSCPPAAAMYLTRFLGEPPGSDSDLYADASPVTHVTSDDAPVLLVHGDADRLVPLSQSQAMQAALDAAGVENQLIVVKHASHNLRGATGADRAAAYDAATQWLVQHLSR